VQTNDPNASAYIAETPADRRATLSAIRALCLKELVGYDETIRYGMPGYARNGVVEVSFASHKQYISLYVLKQDVLDRHRSELAGLSLGKGVIRYRRATDVDLDCRASTARRHLHVRKSDLLRASAGAPAPGSVDVVRGAGAIPEPDQTSSACAQPWCVNRAHTINLEITDETLREVIVAVANTYWSQRSMIVVSDLGGTREEDADPITLAAEARHMHDAHGFNQAKPYWERAAEAGSLPALHQLARAELRAGRTNEGRELLQRCADLGHGGRRLGIERARRPRARD
jgi:uncharacterized protein YdhG (YjbR/CyaY superfamily)